jgi:hypothetical protein
MELLSRPPVAMLIWMMRSWYVFLWHVLVAKANPSLVSLIGAREQRYASDRDGRMIFVKPMFLFPNIAIVPLLLRLALNSAARFFIKE